MRDTRLTRGALAMLGVAGVLAVSACGGGDGTTTEPPASASSSPAPQSSAPPEPKKATPEHPAQNLVPPELPDEATEFTDEGFEAFIEYWFATRNYGLATGDETYIQDVSLEDCAFCESNIEIAQNLARGGGDVWLVGGEMEATDIVAKVHGDQASVQKAYLTLRQFSGDVYDQNGMLEGGNDVHKDEVASFEFAAYFHEGSWVAARIQVED